MKTNNKKVEDKFYGKRVVKGIFAKTKFGKAEQVFKDGSVHLNFSEAQQWLSAASVDELKYIVKDAREAANAMGTGGNKWNYYHDLVLTAQDELGKRKSKMTRTGGKAKFAKEYILWAVPKGKTDTMYSQPIAEQLYTDSQINEVKRKATAAGWHTFRIAEMMSFEDMTNAFKGKPVKRRSSRTGSKAKFAVVGSKGNKTAIVIRNGPDADASWIAYVVQDYKTSNEDVIGNMRHYSTEARAKAAALRGLETSGLRASRQGSKEKFANGVYGNEEIAKGLSKVLKANGFDAMASGILTGPKDSETLRKYIRALKSKLSPMGGNDRGMFLLQTLEKQLASRTGAKAFK